MSQSRQVLPCPNCGTQLGVPSGKRGNIRCPNCTLLVTADTRGPKGSLQLYKGSRVKILARDTAKSVRHWFSLRRSALILPAVILIILIARSLSISVSTTGHRNGSNPPSQAAQIASFDGVERTPPGSGAVWMCTGYGVPCKRLPPNVDGAPFAIKSSGGSNYLIKMTLSPARYVLIFVRGGTSPTVSVPFGEYALTYLSGPRWYGFRSDNKVFGPKTTAEKANQALRFTWDRRITITLYRVPGGNMRTHWIPLKEF